MLLLVVFMNYGKVTDFGIEIVFSLVPFCSLSIWDALKGNEWCFSPKLHQDIVVESATASFQMCTLSCSVHSLVYVHL